MDALAVCRFAHFMGSMLAFGSSAYLWLYAPDELCLALSPSVWRLAFAASVIALVSAFLWLVLEAASMAGDWEAAVEPGMIVAVLTDTDFGRVWLPRLVLAVALVAVILVLPGPWGAIAVLSGVLLAGLALAGHADMHTGVEGMFQRGNHAVHLVAAGAWLGGLTAFIGSLNAYAKDGLRCEAVRAMARFSFFSQFVVAAIVVTGVVNIALISGDAPIPPTTPYRELLSVKIALVAIMIGLAIVNRFVLTPRLAPGRRALAVMRATSASEVALGVIVVALVSVFAMLDPA